MWANVARQAARRGALQAVRYPTALSGARTAPVMRTALPSGMRALSGSAVRREEPKDGQAPIGEVEPKLRMSLTCAVPGCGTRSSHEFTKRSYTRGVVIVQCPGCQNRYVRAQGHRAAAYASGTSLQTTSAGSHSRRMSPERLRRSSRRRAARSSAARRSPTDKAGRPSRSKSRHRM